DIIHLLETAGAVVKAYDPAAMAKVQADGILPRVILCQDAYEAAKDADALVIVTEWNEFKRLDMRRIRDALRLPVIVDGRNLYDPAQMRAFGFTYWSVGRAVAHGATPASETLSLVQ
ncbi:MAG: UDP-glucose/GDP-mannose dehydrogenase family protein, partial [Chloroflexota bacterium]